jgi:5'-deoxynucleotidase
MRDMTTLYDAGCVQRFHTLRTIQQHSIAHHTWGVCLILLQITTPSAQLLAAAMYHDLAEAVTGDIPAPVKWAYPKLDSALREVEEEFDRYHSLIVDLNDDELECLKWADMLELIMFCRSEMRMGNSLMREVYDRGVSHLVGKQPPTPAAAKLLHEVRYA